jgi:hypothetical protein
MTAHPLTIEPPNETQADRVARRRQLARMNGLRGDVEIALKAVKRALDMIHEAEDAEEAGAPAWGAKDGTRDMAAELFDLATSLVRHL